MSRSRRKTPIMGHTCGGWNKSEKNDKKIANRKLRKKVKMLIVKGIYEFPLLREVSNVWDFIKDGKSWFGYSYKKRKYLRK